MPSVVEGCRRPCSWWEGTDLTDRERGREREEEE